MRSAVFAKPSLSKRQRNNRGDKIEGILKYLKESPLRLVRNEDAKTGHPKETMTDISGDS
jgi:hypothetical protein